MFQAQVKYSPYIYLQIKVSSRGRAQCRAVGCCSSACMVVIQQCWCAAALVVDVLDGSSGCGRMGWKWRSTRC